MGAGVPPRRLDGTARVLVIGQDPATHEAICRRILVGEAGQRVQGLLARLGVNVSYGFVNAFLYSVYGQGGGNRNIGDERIAAYRNAWLQALAHGNRIEGVVALGTLADKAYQASPLAASGTHAYAAMVHPRPTPSPRRPPGRRRRQPPWPGCANPGTPPWTCCTAK